MRTFGIDLLSVFSLPPTEFVQLAAAMDRPTISMALAPFGANPENHPTWSLRTDRLLRQNLRATLAGEGVIIALGEGFVVVPGVDVRMDFQPDMELMAELGARRICVVSFDPDPERTLDAYAETTQLAVEAGLECVVEFAPCFPSTPNLASAITAKAHVARSEFRLLVDTMHLGRSGGTAEELRALPPDTVGYVQLCDVTRDPLMADYMTEAMRERRVPGEGEMPLLDFVAALPENVPYSLEIPLADEAASGSGPRDRMHRAVKATIELMRTVAERS